MAYLPQIVLRNVSCPDFNKNYKAGKRTNNPIQKQERNKDSSNKNWMTS